MPAIYVASSNRGKLADFATAANVHGVDVLPLPGIEKIPAPEETGATFEENARLKAEYYSRYVRGEIVIADDSGLTVAALGGAPGVRSARYAEDAGAFGELSPDEANNRLLLMRTEEVAEGERQCAFVAVIAAAQDGKTLASFKGEAHGTVLREPRGANGFGYDPLFFFPEVRKSFAELSREEKLRVSHRGQAFSAFLNWFCARQR
jgi:XTP/dITP diphosphohydrolase